MRKLFLDPKMCDIVPVEIKSCQTLEEFKKKIKSWIFEIVLACFVKLHQKGFKN